MLEKQILKEFKEFSKRRIASEYNVENKKVYEDFIFSSCGDEFFRDEKLLEEVIKNSNPKRYEKLANMDKSEIIWMSEDGEGFNPIIISKSEYYEGILNLHMSRVGKKNEINVIGFGACRISKIPFISTKIELNESFSTHKDFHAMHYNEQMLNYKVNYIWILFKWVRISKKVENY